MTVLETETIEVTARRLTDDQLVDHLLETHKWKRKYLADNDMRGMAAAGKDLVVLRAEILRRMETADPVLRNGKHN